MSSTHSPTPPIDSKMSPKYLVVPISVSVIPFSFLTSHLVSNLAISFQLSSPSNMHHRIPGTTGPTCHPYLARWHPYLARWQPYNSLHPFQLVPPAAYLLTPASYVSDTRRMRKRLAAAGI